MLPIVVVDCFLVRFVEIFRQYNVTIFSHSLQPSLGTDAADVCAGDFLWPIHVALQVQIFAKVHFAGGCLENHSLLPSVRNWKLNFAVQPPWPKQRRVQCVGPVGGHDHLDVRLLVKAVHLVQQLEEDPLHFAICAGLGVESLGGNRIDFVDEDYAWRVLSGESGAESESSYQIMLS
tara:strand:- start:12 stop:542 length:531 start_codon:yes stop_codon:yes gene_type:complete